MKNSNFQPVEAIYFPPEERQKIEKTIEEVESFSKKIGKKPSDFVFSTSSLMLIGNYFAMIKNFEKAIQYYDYVLEIEQENVFALVNKGLALHYSRRSESGLITLDKASKIKTTAKEFLAEIHYNRGIVLNALEQFREAVMAYDKALENNPDLVAALSNSANLLTKLGFYDDAIDRLNKALTIEPHDPRLRHNLDLTLRKKEEWKLAQYVKQYGAFPGEKIKELTPKELEKITTFFLLLKVPLGSGTAIMDKIKNLLSNKKNIDFEISEVMDEFDIYLKLKGPMFELKEVITIIRNIEHVKDFVTLARVDA